MEHSCAVCPNCLEPLGEGAVCGHCGFDAGSYVVLPHHLVPGTLVKQRYRVGRVLGEGGFGITYVGRDTVLNLKIAIKEFYMAGYVNRNHEASLTVFATLGTHQDTFTKNKEKFLSEARVLARFYEEPGIVGVRDFCEENGTAYIIMDFLDGVTLKNYLDERKRLAPAEAIRLLMPVMRSLQHVHAGGVIHRDISPDNIMVLGDGRTKLLDFGAAREVSQTDIKSLSVILKPGYAPEEQYRSKGRQGPWTDVYALAATLYRCIVGETPDDAMERMYRDQLPAPADTEAACPAAISRVIMKGLAVRQPDRYQDVPAFLQDLEAALAAPEDAAIAADALRGPAEPGPVLTRGPAAPGADRTVLADLPTGRTVLADQAVQGGEAALAPQAEPAPQPEPDPKPEPQPQPEAKPDPKPEAEPKPEQKPGPAPRPAAGEKAAPRYAPQKTETPKAPEAPEKNTKKKPPILPIAAVAALAVIVSAVFWPKGSAPTAPAAVSTPTAQSSTPAAQSAASGAAVQGSSADIFQFSLNGQTFTLPIPLSDLIASGWVTEDPALENVTLAPGESRSSVVLLNEYGSIGVWVENQSPLEQPLQQCSVTYLSVGSNLNDNYLGETGNTFALARGAELGMEESEILALYPELTATDSGNYEYESSDGSDFLSILFFEGRSTAASLSTTRTGDWVETEAYVAGEPAEYSDAAFLSDYALSGFSFTFNGTACDAPLTVQSLLDAGWTLERAPQSLPARSSATVYLRYDVRTTLAVRAYNYTANAIEPAYGLLSDSFGLEVSDNGYTDNAITDPAASFSYKGSVICTLGDEKSAVRAAAEAAGLRVENDANNYGLEIYGAQDSAVYVYVYFHQGTAAGYQFMSDPDEMDFLIEYYQYEEDPATQAEEE